MQQKIRTVLGAALGVALCQPAVAAWPEDRPIEVVVGFAAGGGTDVMARKLFASVEKRLDKAKFVVINKPGAGGEIAMGYLARANPDGYTIGVINVPGFLFLPLTKKTQYSPGDIRMIARVVDDPTVLTVRAGAKLSQLGEVIDALRKKPGSISFGHNGTGTNGQLALQMLSGTTKVELNEIPYKGTAAQKTDLLGGHLDVALVSVGEVPELHGANRGELKVVAQLATVRSPALPNVPTAQEAGVSVLMSSERGIGAPKAIPDGIVRKLESAIAESVKDPEFIASSPGDAPVLAYLPGAQWQASLDKSMPALRALADKLPK